MAWVPIAIAAVGAVSSMQQGQQAAEQADIAGRQNQQILQGQAVQAQNIAEVNAEQQQKADARLMAAQRARFGAAGVDFTTGSALNVLTQTAKEAELDRQRILAGGTVEAARLRNEANVARYQGDATREYSQSQGQAGFLSGLGQTANLYSRSYGT